MKNLDDFAIEYPFITLFMVGCLMKKLDEANLDIRHLQMFVVVMTTGNMTQAAHSLNIKQSTISHAMEKLRMIFADPLFIRSGRGIIPTQRAETLLPEIEALLEQYQQLKRPPIFTPSEASITYTIAANDFLRDEITPIFYRQIKPLVKCLRLTIIPADLPNLTLLKEEKADMVISAFRPDSSYIMSKKLFSTRAVCFYDSNQRQAPQSLQDYTKADYICPAVIADSFTIDKKNEEYSKHFIRHQATVITPSFASAAACLRQTDALSIAPIELKDSLFSGLSYTELPNEHCSDIYLLWHIKNQKNNKHLWVRQQLAAMVKQHFLLGY